MILIGLAGSSLTAGCAQQGPLLSRRTTIGTLKATVSQLEFEREQLRREIAALKSENQRIENLLAQEEATNGELQARLDDARTVLRNRGYDDEFLASPSRSAPNPPATKPAARPSRPGRKPPFARIPAQLDPEPSTESSGTRDDELLDAPPPSPRSDPVGLQGRLEDRSHWRRVAREDDGLELEGTLR
jgi:outer membrane murein-binding lipoprotein Lpp